MSAVDGNRKSRKKDDYGADGDGEAKMKREMKRGYAGGSAGKGGGYHNQRGGGNAKKKQKYGR